MTPIIRPLTIDDHPLCEALWRVTEGIGESPTRTQLAAFIKRNPGFSQVAEVEGRILGVLLVSFDGIRGYFYRAAVDRSVRRQGIARALITSASQQLQSAGAIRINLHVFGNNQPALAFWHTLGWRPYEGLLCLRRELS